MASEKSLTVQQQKLLNGVSYELLPESTIATSRTFKRQYFQKTEYKQQTQAICDWNTGDAYINPRRSYLAIKVSAAAQANFGVGGVTNLIRRIVITSRSRTEVSRTENYNLLATKLIRYGCSRAYVDENGEIMGYTNDLNKLALDHDQLTTENTFLIPLSLLSGFFAGDGKTLIPPQLAAGLRIELTLESNIKALVGASATSYTISDISFMLNTTQMVSSWQKQISDESSRDGLTYSFSEYHTSQSTMDTNGTKINVEVRKAVARALSAFAMGTIKADSGTKDNMKSEPFATVDTVVEWRLGSLYPTQQPITTVNESYFQAQNMFDGGLLDCKRTNNVNVSSFTTSTDSVANTAAVVTVPSGGGDITLPADGGTLDGMGVYAVSLERSDVAINGVLNIGGLPTNNSRSLSLDLQTAGVAGARTFYLFMKHLRIAKVFLDNVSVSE